jgi:hypothetical protein
MQGRKSAHCCESNNYTENKISLKMITMGVSKNETKLIHTVHNMPKSSDKRII